MTAYLITPPGAEPLTPADAKSWLRLDGTEEDVLVAALISVARSTVEREARRCLMTQGWRVTFDAWPGHGLIELPLAPVQSVTAVRVLDASGVATLAAPTSYRLDPLPDTPRLWITGPVSSPGLPVGGIEIDLVCGYGANAADVPAPLRHAMRVLIARMFEQRGDGAVEGAALPAEVASLVAGYRRPRL